MSSCTSPNQRANGTTHLVLKSSAASLALSICTTSLAFSDLVHRVWGNKEVTSGKEKAFCWQELPILLPSSAGMTDLLVQDVSCGKLRKSALGDEVYLSFLSLFLLSEGRNLVLLPPLPPPRP